MGKVGRIDLTGAITAGAQLVDTHPVDIEADNGRRTRKGHGHRQAHIAEADDGNLATMAHAKDPSPAVREPVLTEAGARPQ